MKAFKGFVPIISMFGRKKTKDSFDSRPPIYGGLKARSIPQYSKEVLTEYASFLKKQLGRFPGSLETFAGTLGSIDMPLLYYLMKPSLFPSPLNEIAYATAEGVSLAMTAHGFRRGKKED